MLVNDTQNVKRGDVLVRLGPPMPTSHWHRRKPIWPSAAALSVKPVQTAAR